MSEWHSLDLGPVDAYGAAVKAGYTGTRQQWMQAMADAEANGLKAEGYAVGKQNGTDVTSGTYYHNNAKHYRDQAESSATAAAGSASDAAGSATGAAGSATAAAASAADAEISKNYARAFTGAPRMAATVADMTDHELIYVYLGSETSYTSGHWYYWNGTAWTDGGAYNSTALVTDTTLTVSGSAADAAATGNLKGLIAPSEATSTAAAAHAAGSYLIYNGVLYHATKAIAAGDTLATTGADANIAAVPGGVTGEVAVLKSALNASLSGNEDQTFTTTKSGGWTEFDYIFVEGIKYSLTGSVVFGFRTRVTGSETNIDSGSSIPEDSAYEFTASGNAQVLRITTVSPGTVTVTQKNSVIGDINTINSQLPALNTAKDVVNTVTEDYEAFSDNLYDSQTSETGYRLDASGRVKEAADPECYVSGWIAIEPNKTYYRIFYGDAYHRMSFYNSEQVHQYSTTDESYENSSGYAYLRICGYASEINSEEVYYSEDVKTAIDYVARNRNNDSEKTVDLIVFAGQSNMAGRGITNETWTETAPTIIPGAGYEFRAISDPIKLYPMIEPFGYAEDNVNGINDLGRKTGSMVVSFTNAYYLHNGKIPVVGVSASQGDTYTTDWIVDPEGQSLLTDLIARFNAAITWLTTNGYTIRHKYCLWCQGEADGGGGTTTHNEYKGRAITIFNTLLSAGFETVFMVRIGQKNDTDYDKYDTVITDQTDIAREMPNVVMASTDFAGMRVRGLMKDRFHYYQAGYNEIGTYSGINVALYERTEKEPTMYDPFYDNLYYSTKN